MQINCCIYFKVFNECCDVESSFMKGVSEISVFIYTDLDRILPLYVDVNIFM